MKRYTQLFNKSNGVVIGMVHTLPLIASPSHSSLRHHIFQNLPSQYHDSSKPTLSFPPLSQSSLLPLNKKMNSLTIDLIIERAVSEANIYKRNGINGIIIENMHDIPYIKDLGPEIVSWISVICQEVRREVGSDYPIGLQILGAGSKQALAVASATKLNFIRCEGFVFGHVGDEGWHDACAGSLLRYRSQLNCEHVSIWTDIKKKHASHAVTSDLSIGQTAEAADFFLTDGLIVTGSSTGVATSIDDLKEVTSSMKVKESQNKESGEEIRVPVLVGSGVELKNLPQTFDNCSGMIVGSFFKENSNWVNPIEEKRVADFMKVINSLTNQRE